MQHRRLNLAAAAARWSTTHRRAAVAAWLVFVGAAFGVGSVVGFHRLTAESSGSGQSQTAQTILDRAGLDPPASETVIVESAARTVADPEFERVIERVVAAVSALPQVTGVESPLGRARAELVSKSGHAALVAFEIRGNPDDAADPSTIEPVLDRVAQVASSSPGFYVAEFGAGSASYELNRTLGTDFHRAEQLSIPITFLILWLAFGAFVAAIVPLALGITAVVAALGLDDIVSFGVPKGDATSSVILMIGLAVGVDYSLFYLRRTREERAGGKAPLAALRTAAATSGQAVLVSGSTVLIAMAGMLIAGSPIFTSVGVGTMLVVAAAVIGSLSVLPAVLARLGDGVERGRLPLVARHRSGAGESRFWRFVTVRSLRHPVVTIVVAGGALLALAVPALGMHTALTSFTDLPRGLAIVQTYERIQAAFPGTSTPALVAVAAPDVTAPSVRAALARLEREALETRQMGEPVDVTVGDDGHVARVEIALLGGTQEQEGAVRLLRGKLIPETLGAVPGVKAYVGGSAAASLDFNERMTERAPFVFVFVLALAFVLLLLAFRSVVVPLTTIVLNLLSVGASYGFLVLVFQHTWAERILDFRSTGAITAWLPLFLFVVLFGLSMDYHVFILSRIKERVDRGEATREAVLDSISSSASTVTAAAIVMVAVFATFAALRTIDLKQLGLGLAFAVLVDATVIRALLVPAAMALLGERNWYLPRRLAWLPNVSIEAPADEPTPAPAPSGD